MTQDQQPEVADALNKIETALRFQRNRIEPTGDEGVEYMLALQTIRAHLQQRPLPVREHLYDIVPPSAAEWFADSHGIANHDWRGGWDACRNRCRTLVDERLAASPPPSVQNAGVGGTDGR